MQEYNNVATVIDSTCTLRRKSALQVQYVCSLQRYDAVRLWAAARRGLYKKVQAAAPDWLDTCVIN